MPRPPSEDRLRLWRSVACVAEALCLTVGRCGLELSVAASELCGSGSCSASVSELLGLVEDRVAARRCELEELLKAVAAEILEPVENWRNSVECAEDRVSEEIISKAMLPIVLKNLPSLVKVLTSEPEKRAILISKLPKDLAARCERVIRCCRSLWGRNENHVELGKAMEIARELHEFIPRNYVDDAIDQLTGSLSACPMAIIDGHYHVEATVPGATEDLTEGSAVADQDEWGQGDDEDILQYLIPPEELEARLEQSKEVDESSDVAEPRKRATRARKSVSSSLPKTTKSPSSRPRDSSTKAQETSTNTSGPSNSPKRRRNSPSSKASTPPRVTRSSRKSKATNSG